MVGILSTTWLYFTVETSMVMCVLSYWLDSLDAAQMRQIWLLLLLLPILFGWFLIDTVRTTICQINNPRVHLRRHKYLIRNISTTRFELISFEAASLSILHFQTSKIRRVVVSRVSFYVHSREHETTYATSFRAFSVLARFPQNENASSCNFCRANNRSVFSLPVLSSVQSSHW